MLEGLNAAAAGMAAQQDRIAAISNDVANVSTTGYKHVRTAFRDLMYTEGNRPGAGQNVRLGAGAATTDLGRAFQQGALQDTGRSLDVGLQGDGFLRVRLPDGREALTRDGNLQVDGSGRLVTSTGATVLPPMTVPNDGEPSIAKDGTITVEGRRVGKMDVVSVRAPQGLLSAGDNAFTVTAASGPATPDADTRVLAGMLEQSNVDLATAMTEIIEAQRAYELASRAITTADQLMEIANGVKR